MPPGETPAKEPLRCRLFGHVWFNPDLPAIYPVTWCAGGAEDFLVCKRCSVTYVEVTDARL